MRSFVGRVAAPRDARAESDAGHRNLPVLALLHHAFGFIDIIVDDEPGPPREVEEEQHVAGGKRGDERLLRIDAGLVGPGRGDDMRAGLAGTTAPPSNAHSCARLYWPLVKSPSPVRFQRIVAV